MRKELTWKDLSKKNVGLAGLASEIVNLNTYS